MASIFTFDPDPPRVSSPWSTPPLGSKPQSRIPQDPSVVGPRQKRVISSSSVAAQHDDTVTRLEAEPQEGPTEYKLHLLLRRRRSFSRVSTGRHVSGSHRPRTEALLSPTPRSASESNLANPLPATSSTQSRQHRLEQLTTQLLWRLQQSSQYHSSSANNLILPHLPDASELSSANVPRKLLPGLEESRGALYEIGVADDGTFVGLAEDEMEESLNNLRAMAASLGCLVEILRKVPVGDCEWFEDVDTGEMAQRMRRTGKLWVTEAFVRPDLSLLLPERKGALEKDSKPAGLRVGAVPTPDSGASTPLHSSADQLRVSLTGATMSGKSSLLGCLSTATFDNGRGKSRLSLLKHRHEIASGMTSSVTQELIGYRDSTADGAANCFQVVNYACGNVSSWTDIHAASESGRLVFLSDSAGHPRYRRTTVRGLVGWAPHWTVLCIPADNSEDTSGKVGSTPSSQDVLGFAAADVDLSQAHLELCLNLDLPLVVVITKLDLATKNGLRQTLSSLLSALKAAGRKPSILSDASTVVDEADLHVVSSKDLADACKTARTVTTSPTTVPIVLTSAVNGTGISKLHALLHELPLPLPVIPLTPSHRVDGTDRPLLALFHVEEIYSTLSPSKALPNTDPDVGRGVVVGGHLQYGTLSLGQELLLGPYPMDVSDDSDSGSGKTGTSPTPRPLRPSSIPTSRSFPGALHKRSSAFHPSRHFGQENQHEWRRVQISSLRNLRLPVLKLLAGQVGTIGVVPLDQPISTPAIVRVRKGMVLVHGSPVAKRVIRARFVGKHASSVNALTVGSAVVVYVASVRASAKIVSVAIEPGQAKTNPNSNEDDDDSFGFGFDDDDSGSVDGENSNDGIATAIVTFQFIASREFVECGAQILIVPGGGPGLYGGMERGEKGVAGLEGYVGTVVDEDM
ncbi:uncharacterized protein BDZ99DRAFT_459789 [Mytilinidion resinicola]|uniref:Tr-type G domain-containing protein n=1 Tax=Mytilinidion resinicola TaxID=574789 RepID=A0A6A6YYP1_9PEZI|nr:uncharacterized protein BDZ99DRAFT_459789 [Mytilinidion resinicola]KAF2814056.1 hypothetical protein BDZ99DRAFT_459789 [Mytilinidion resinicola]